MKVGDMVKVKAQKSFQDDLQDNRICHAYDIGTIAQIVYEDEYFSVPIGMMQSLSPWKTTSLAADSISMNVTWNLPTQMILP